MVTEPNSGTTHYQYDLLGRRTQVADPDDNVTTFIYDDLDRVIREEIVVGGQTLTRKFDYDLVGNLIREVNRNGEVRRLEYDKNYLLDQEFWYASVADEAADLADGVAGQHGYA